MRGLDYLICCYGERDLTPKADVEFAPQSPMTTLIEYSDTHLDEHCPDSLSTTDASAPLQVFSSAGSQQRCKGSPRKVGLPRSPQPTPPNSASRSVNMFGLDEAMSPAVNNADIFWNQMQSRGTLKERVTLEIEFLVSSDLRRFRFGGDAIVRMVFEESDPRVVKQVPVVNCAHEMGVKPGMKIVTIGGVDVSAMENMEAAHEIRSQLGKFNKAAQEYKW